MPIAQENPVTKTFIQIQKQIKSLQIEAEKLQRKEVGGVIARIKEAIATYGLTAADLGLAGPKAGRPTKAGAAKAPKRAATKKSRAGAGAKFRDDAGNVWGGRGPRPRWLRDALAAGKSLSDFAAS
ncbi:MAG: hypothetical protein RLZZ618_3349 [Pseudomonadota bacterium]